MNDEKLVLSQDERWLIEALRRTHRGGPAARQARAGHVRGGVLPGTGLQPLAPGGPALDLIGIQGRAMIDLHDEFRVDAPALRAAVRAGAITEDEAILLAGKQCQGVHLRHELAQLAGSRGLRRRLAALPRGERSAVTDTETVQAARARLERNVRIVDRVRLAEEAGDLDEANRLRRSRFSRRGFSRRSNRWRLRRGFGRGAWTPG